MVSATVRILLQTVAILTDNITILTALRSGNKKLFADLYDFYSPSLFKNIYKLLHNTADAEDVLQSVFLTLWEQRTTLSDNQSVAGWLFSTSFYLSMTFLRKKLRARIEELNEALEDQPLQGFQEMEQVYIQRSLFLQEAIHQLPERKRRAFELCRIEGRSYQEAADTLGITADTVKEYVKSAVKTLKLMAAKTDASFYACLLLFIA